MARRISCTGSMRRDQGNREKGHLPTSARHWTIGGQVRGPEGRRVRNRRTAVVWPGPEEGPGALWVRRDRGQEERSVGKEAKGCAAEAADAEKAGNAGKARASAAGKLALIVPSVAEAVHGKSGTCSGALWSSSAGEASSVALAERASEACEAQRAVWALSSGSTTSRATGVTSEEPTVEGTRGEPIGVAILSVARPNTSPNLVWARKTASWIGRSVPKRAAAKQQSTIGGGGTTADNL